MQAIIGMSPGNSYFKDKEVAFLLRETIKRHGSVAIMVADVPAVSTYIAMGYTIPEAEKKARLKGNGLKNRTMRVLTEMGLDPAAVTIIDRAQDVEPDSFYQHHRTQVQALYEANAVFRAAVDGTSLSVLQNSGKVYDETSLSQAVHYLLSEIAFLEFSLHFFHTDKTAYFYHKTWEVFEDYVAGNFDGKRRTYLEFVLLEAPYETYHSYADSQKSRWDLIVEKGVITCAYIPYYHYFTVDADGKPIGGEFYDLIQKVAAHHHLRVEFVEQVGYGSIAWRLNAGFVDVFACPTWPSTARRLEMFFSESIFPSSVFAYIRADSPYAACTREDLRTDPLLRIAVKEHDIHHELAARYFPLATLVRVPQLSHVQEVVEYVYEHRADMTFWDPELVALYTAASGRNVGELVQKGRGDGGLTPIGTYDNCFALPWGEFALKRAIDEVVLTA